MEYLAKAIRDYPLKSDASGELIIDNYEQALKEVRQWMNSNIGLYVINDGHF
jgi:hypothetical protein